MIRKIGLLLTATLTASLALTTLSPTPSAVACGNEVEHRINPLVRQVVSAERLLSKGEPQKAAAFALRGYPKIRERVVGKNPLSDRALRVMALAVVRSGGNIDGAAAPFAAKTDKERAANLVWASGKLENFLASKKAGSADKTAYGEALAARDDAKSHGLALTLLGELEKDDLVATPYGYAALAKLRRHAGKGKPAWQQAALQRLHAPSAAIAEARCRKMTKNVAICSGSDAVKQGSS